MTEPLSSASDALADNELTTSARTLLAWMRAQTEEVRLDMRTFSVTLDDVETMLMQSRTSASTHLNALESAGHLERFLPGGAKSTNHWRLV